MIDSRSETFVLRGNTCWLIEMEAGYSAEGEVGRKSMLKILSNKVVYILELLVCFGFGREEDSALSRLLELAKIFADDIGLSTVAGINIKF